MNDFWNIYDRLIEGIDPAPKVTDVVCGKTWTAVRNDAGGIGIAMTTAGETIPRSRTRYTGMTVQDAACLSRSWNFFEAGIGMAAVNSFYNTAERMRNNGWEQTGSRFWASDIDLAGKTLGMVGHIKQDSGRLKGLRDLFILELDPSEGEYPAGACEELLPECDIVLITGSAFVNKTLPRLLTLSEHAVTVIAGPTTPMADRILEEFRIRRLTGFVPLQQDALLDFAASGATRSPYGFGTTFAVDRI